MAERLLGRRLAGTSVQVRSAGRLEGGLPASPGAVKALRAFGLDLSDHRSATAGTEGVRSATLVLGLAREHVRDAVATAPEAFDRAFTLKELVRRAAGVGPRGVGEPVEAWLDRVGRGRRPVDLLGDDRSDDVEDPIGRSDRRYRQCAAELDDLLGRLVDLGRLRDGDVAPAGDDDPEPRSTQPAGT